MTPESISTAEKPTNNNLFLKHPTHLFTGIIETLGEIVAIERSADNLTFHIQSEITHELAADQSIAHNGVCLTVEAINGGTYSVTAIAETLSKSNLSSLAIGDSINLERAMIAGGRLDGHFVQGHVDTVATCVEKSDQQGSWLFRFQFDAKYIPLLVEKGSICINGVSLTAFDLVDDTFAVAIIPYTWAHTNFHTLNVGARVNIEFDVLGKYIVRYLKNLQQLNQLT